MSKSTLPEVTVPTPQAVAAWKKKCDRLVEMDAELAKQAAKLEAKLKPIREQFEPDVERLRKQVKELAAEVSEFGVEHRATLFAEGSEIATKIATITGRETPAAVALDEEADEKAVVAALAETRGLKKFLRISMSLDKPAIKAALSDAAEKARTVREALNGAGLFLRKGFAVSVKGKGE